MLKFPSEYLKELTLFVFDNEKQFLERFCHDEGYHPESEINDVLFTCESIVVETGRGMSYIDINMFLEWFEENSRA